MDYMKRNYISLENTVTFPYTIWNHYSTFKDRTNNKIEGWHNGLNFNKNVKPNIFIFIENLMKKQMQADRLLHQLIHGEKPPTRKFPKYEEINNKIKFFTQELDNNGLDPMDFLRKVE